MMHRRPHVLLSTTALLFFSLASAFGHQAKRPFTIIDEIGLQLFIPDAWRPNPRFSPDGRFFAVYSQRGRLDLNRPEYSLRFYRTAQVEDFLKHSDRSQPPLPVWDLRLATDKEGQIIHDWHWLPDSSGVAFVQRVMGKERLVIGNVAEKKLHAVTRLTARIDRFDLRDLGHFVYVAPDPKEVRRAEERAMAERNAAAIVGTGRRLGQLILPGDPIVVQYSLPPACLWAFVDGHLLRVKQNGTPLNPEDDLALSPNGRLLVATLPVDEVPKNWETLYPPPTSTSESRIHAGHETAKQYVIIELKTGTVRPLSGAPTSSDGGWPAKGSPVWANDGQAVLLPGTFVRSQTGSPSRPCAAIVDVLRHKVTCVEVLEAPRGATADNGDHTVSSVRFVDGDKHRVVINHSTPNELEEITEYEQMPDGPWQNVGQRKGSWDRSHNGLEISVQQGIGRPPMLVASGQNVSSVIWDPNPQLKDIELGEAAVFKWKNKDGREFKGGLFKPYDYKVGQRYPLVIQTHGLYESFFFPSGPGMPTAFAARALTAAGIVVLQVDEECPFVTPEEGPCAVSAYESAVSELASMGLIDPERIGIIGFSRTCYYVMETLTTSSLHIKAASITSGLMFDYWQYAFSPDRGEGDAIIGAPPFGEGLQQWLKRSPGFNLDKVRAPLMVAGQGPDVLLTMWAAYAGLRQLHKPVELVMLNSDEHVLTNPTVRIASQGGSVDWFRFWLQGYEDHDPAKAAQYKRWRELKKMQAENDNKSARSEAAAN
jgi:dipeptidyl aminopeptidase/acylaminoacyl peptidase